MKKIPIPNALWIVSGVIAFSATGAVLWNLVLPVGISRLPAGIGWVAAVAWLVYGATTPRRPLEDRDFVTPPRHATQGGDPKRARSDRRRQSRRRRRSPNWYKTPMFRRFGMKQPPED